MQPNIKTDSNQIATLKLVIYGPSNVGKTSLLSLYLLIKKMYQPKELVYNVTKIQNPFQEMALFHGRVVNTKEKQK